MTREDIRREPGTVRDRVYEEIRDALGVVPSMFDHVPEPSLELEWRLFRNIHLEEGAIPAKYRELTALAIAGILRSPYCAYAHTQFARANGATDLEIDEVLHFAKSVSGWVTLASGTQLDFEQFKREIDTLCDHARKLQKAA